MQVFQMNKNEFERFLRDDNKVQQTNITLRSSHCYDLNDRTCNAIVHTGMLGVWHQNACSAFRSTLFSVASILIRSKLDIFDLFPEKQIKRKYWANNGESKRGHKHCEHSSVLGRSPKSTVYYRFVVAAPDTLSIFGWLWFDSEMFF